MALKTNFTDDILAESMNGKRQYNITENSNGTKSLEDVTDYQSVGSTFSAKDMNETNEAVNQAYDDMGEEFNPEVDYAVGDYAIYNNKVWKFTTAHPAGAWDESHVKRTTILGENRELNEKIIFGSFACNSSETTVELGFKPKYIKTMHTYTDNAGKKYSTVSECINGNTSAMLYADRATSATHYVNYGAISSDNGFTYIRISGSEISTDIQYMAIK